MSKTSSKGTGAGSVATTNGRRVRARRPPFVVWVGADRPRFSSSERLRLEDHSAEVHNGKSLEFARNKLDDQAAGLIDLDFAHRDSLIAPPAAGRGDFAGYGLVADTQGVLGSGRALGTGLHHFDPEQPGMVDLGRPAHGIRRIHPVADIPLLIALDASGRAVDLGVIGRQPQRPVLGLSQGRLHRANLSLRTGYDHARD